MMETIKVKANIDVVGFPYRIINVEELTPDMELYDEPDQATVAGEATQENPKDVPPVTEEKPTAKRKRS
jgi:hypothetical protein